MTCTEFSELGLTGHLASDACPDASTLVSPQCGCSPIGETSAPVAVHPTTLQPTEVGGLEPGPDPPCNVCGEGNQVTILDPIVVIPGQDAQPTCSEFAEGGFAGYIPAAMCPLAAGLIFELCGCSPKPDVVAPMTLAPATMAPSVGGGEGLEPGPDPPCNVCGEGNQVTIFDPIVVIPGQEVLPTCGEFAEGGFAGYIPAALCPLAAGLIFDLCGCAPMLN